MAEDTLRHSEQRPRLGRGLAALLGENHPEPASPSPRKGFARRRLNTF